MFASIILAAEGHHEPNGMIIPSDFNEVIWASIAFLLVATLIIWKGGPAIKGMWSGRIDRIAKEVDDAGAARAEAEAKLAEVQGRIANAAEERQRIVAEATRTASAISEQIAARTETDLVEIRARATADAAASKAQVEADLRSEIAELAIGAAEEVVNNSLDSATKTDLIESYITKVAQAS